MIQNKLKIRFGSKGNFIIESIDDTLPMNYLSKVHLKYSSSDKEYDLGEDIFDTVLIDIKASFTEAVILIVNSVIYFFKMV